MTPRRGGVLRVSRVVEGYADARRLDGMEGLFDTSRYELRTRQRKSAKEERMRMVERKARYDDSVSNVQRAGRK
jgi:hypothetical protein